MSEFPKLVLELPARRDPINLNRLLMTMRPAKTVTSSCSADDVAIAFRVLGRSRDGHAVRPSRQEARALVRAASSSDLADARVELVDLVLRAESVGWRRLWSLWELAGASHKALPQMLSQRLAARCSTSPRFRERLPQWLPETEAGLLSAFLDPGPCAQRHCESASIPITELGSGLAVGLDSVVGSLVAEHMVREGSAKWWALCSSSAVAAWAEQRPTRVSAAVADRLLIEHGAGASGAHDVRPAPELVSFVLSVVGDPYVHPERWKAITGRAREVFEWLVVAAELGKILAEFARHAEKDRAEFWQRQIKNIRDARYYMAGGTAVCMMVINTTLVIEFGLTGNACYFYRAPRAPLRTASLRGWSTSYFKRRTGLQLSGEQLGFREKLSHMKGWQREFRELLSRQVL